MSPDTTQNELAAIPPGTGEAPWYSLPAAPLYVRSRTEASHIVAPVSVRLVWWCSLGVRVGQKMLAGGSADGGLSTPMTLSCIRRARTYQDQAGCRLSRDLSVSASPVAMAGDMASRIVRGRVDALHAQSCARSRGREYGLWREEASHSQQSTYLQSAGGSTRHRGEVLNRTD